MRLAVLATAVFVGRKTASGGRAKDAQGIKAGGSQGSASQGPGRGRRRRPVGRPRDRPGHHMEALAELFAEDVVWHIQAATRSRATLRDALPPSHHCQRVRAFDGTLLWNSTMSWVLDDDNHTVALLRCTAPVRRQDPGHELRPGLSTQRRQDHRGMRTVERPGSARRILDEDVDIAYTSRSGQDRYNPGLFLAMTSWDVSSRVRDACANSSTASVRPLVPPGVADPVTTRGDGPTVEDEPRSAGNREMSASRRSSRIPSRRPSTDARMTTGATPCLPRWLIAEPLQPSAVLDQPGRRAFRPGQILLIALASGLAAEELPDTERQQTGQSHVFVFRR